MTDVVNVGDELEVEIIAVDDRGKIKVHKATIEEPATATRRRAETASVRAAVGATTARRRVAAASAATASAPSASVTVTTRAAARP